MVLLQIKNFHMAAETFNFSLGLTKRMKCLLKNWYSKVIIDTYS